MYSQFMMHRQKNSKLYDLHLFSWKKKSLRGSQI